MSYRIWKNIVKKYNISNDSVVLILAGENLVIDEVAVNRLTQYKNKRFATKAFVILPKNYDIEVNGNEKLIYLSKKKISKLYHLYCFVHYFDNLVFTFINTPKDNNLGQYLSKSDVTEEDIVCLALYRLGKV